MEKYGFVYIWRDRKHKRYYIGAHWGTEDDGYICSSTWMMNAYKRRPQDFKRRILKRIKTSRLDLYQEEYYWLKMIKYSEIKIRYYNLRIRAAPLWHFKEKENPMKGRKHSNETKEKISKANKIKLSGKNNPRYGKKLSKEAKQLIGKASKERWTDEYRQNHLNKKSDGTYITPWGSFINASIAVRHPNSLYKDSEQVRNYCKNNKTKFSRAFKGRTPSEFGYDFIPKSNSLQFS